MTGLTQQELRVVESFRQLEPERRRYVPLAMARADAEAWKQFQTQGESQLCDATRDRGLDWESMDDDQSQEFAEEIAR